MNAANVYFNAPEKKAERLIFANKISGLTPDTLYTFKILYTDYSTGLRQESLEKLLRTFPNDPTLRNSLTVVFGGNIGNLDSTLKMHTTVAKHNPYAAFLGGDLAYDSGFIQ